MQPQTKAKRANGKKGKHVGADGVNLFTRRQAAATLGVHVATVRQWESRQALAAKIVEGVHLFTAEQIELLRASRQGKLAGLAFQMFEDGKTPVQVVIELGIDPQRIAKMHLSYVQLSQSWVVKGPSGPRAAWERTYRIGELTSEKLRRALELVSTNPALREKLLANANELEPRKLAQ